MSYEPNSFERRGWILKTIRDEKIKISADNGFYDWGLSNPIIKAAMQDSCDAANMYLSGKIEQHLFIASLYWWFQTVYDETDKAWKARWQPKREKDIPLPIDCVKMTIRDREFTTEKFHKWFYLDKYAILFEFDNEIGEQDYSHLEVFHDENTVISFGKYKGLTVGYVLEHKPDYLVWCKHNTLKFNFTPEFWQKVLDEVELRK